jgi:hypothetical protein
MKKKKNEKKTSNETSNKKNSKHQKAVVVVVVVVSLLFFFFFLFLHPTREIAIGTGRFKTDCLLLVEVPGGLDLRSIRLDHDSINPQDISLDGASGGDLTVVVLAHNDELVTIHEGLPLSHELGNLLLDLNPVSSKLKLALLGLEGSLVNDLDLVALNGDDQGHSKVVNNLAKERSLGG